MVTTDHHVPPFIHLFFSCLLQSRFKFKSRLKIKFIEWQNEFFCNFSSSNIKVLADQEISKVDYCLIIQGKCFLVFTPGSNMDISDTCYTPTLTVSVTLDEDIVGQNEFNQITTTDSGNLARTHYTFFIKSTSSST